MVKSEKQTLGEYFKDARKEKGISIDEIVRDTNIPKKYLEAIEADSFELFPGETYAMGFISNYAEALEVDHEMAIALYKRQMKIEQEAPIEELVGKKKIPWLENSNIIISAGAAGLLLIIFVVFIISRHSGDSGMTGASKSYYFGDDELGKVSTQKLKSGDALFITNSERTIEMDILRIEPARSLMFRVSNKNYTIKISELLSIDSANDGTNDLGIELVSAERREAKLALTLLKENPDFGDISNKNDIVSRYKEYILSENEYMESPAKTPVNLKVISQGTGYLGYTPDGQTNEIKVGINNGMVLSIPFTNNLLLDLGNSGVVRLVLGSKEEVGGGGGEVSQSLFYWKPKNGQFSLVRAILK